MFFINKLFKLTIASAIAFSVSFCFGENTDNKSLSYLYEIGKAPTYKSISKKWICFVDENNPYSANFTTSNKDELFNNILNSFKILDFSNTEDLPRTFADQQQTLKTKYRGDYLLPHLKIDYKIKALRNYIPQESDSISSTNSEDSFVKWEARLIDEEKDNKVSKLIIKSKDKAPSQYNICFHRPINSSILRDKFGFSGSQIIKFNKKLKDKQAQLEKSKPEINSSASDDECVRHAGTRSFLKNNQPCNPWANEAK